MSLKTLKSILFEQDKSNIIKSYETELKDVNYDTGKVFNSADFLKKASRPADRLDTTEELESIIDKINPDDEDIIELLKSFSEEYDKEPWYDNINETHAAITTHDHEKLSAHEDIDQSNEEFLQVVRQFMEMGYSKAIAVEKAKQRLGK